MHFFPYSTCCNTSRLQQRHLHKILQPELWNVIVHFITICPFSGNFTQVNCNFWKCPSNFTCFPQSKFKLVASTKLTAVLPAGSLHSLTCGTPSQSSACCMASRALSTGFFGSQVSQSGHRPASTFQFLGIICKGASLAEETEYKLHSHLYYAAIQKDIQSFAEITKTRWGRSAHWNTSETSAIISRALMAQTLKPVQKDSHPPSLSTKNVWLTEKLYNCTALNLTKFITNTSSNPLCSVGSPAANLEKRVLIACHSTPDCIRWTSAIALARLFYKKVRKQCLFHTSSHYSP